MLQGVNFAMFRTIGTKKHEEAIKQEFDLMGEEVPMKHVEKLIAKCIVGRFHCKHNSFFFLHGNIWSKRTIKLLEIMMWQ